MQRTLSHLHLLATIACCWPFSLVLAQQQAEPTHAIRSFDAPRCFLAGKQASIFFSLEGNADAREDPASRETTATWSLIVKGRTLSQGRDKPSPVVDTKGTISGSIIIATFQLPTLKKSVVLPAELKLTWTENGETYHHSRPITIYSDDPFSFQKLFFEQAKIALFDPVGNTAEILDAHEIPYSVLPNLSALESVDEGIVLIGEGLSFRKQRRLAETLLLTADRGLQVLCLAPSEGDFLLSVQNKNARILPSRVLLERDDFVHRYDKRFDTIARGSLWVLTPKRNAVVFRAGAAPDLDQLDSWAILTCDFPNRSEEMPSDTQGGKLIVCSAGIMQYWQTSPVPRYLFIHFLQELTPTQSTEEN